MELRKKLILYQMLSLHQVKKSILTQKTQNFLENNSNKEYHYSKAYFEIEAEQSETWYQLTQLYDPSKDNEDDAVINPTERLSLSFDISSVYGELPSGHYRIIVSISYFESPKDWDYDTYYLACEFTLKQYIRKETNENSKMDILSYMQE